MRLRRVEAKVQATAAAALTFRRRGSCKRLALSRSPSLLPLSRFASIPSYALLSFSFSRSAIAYHLLCRLCFGSAAALPLLCFRTAFTLPPRCLCSAFTLPSLCLRSAFALPPRCLFSALSLPVAVVVLLVLLPFYALLVINILFDVLRKVRQICTASKLLFFYRICNCRNREREREKHL